MNENKEDSIKEYLIDGDDESIVLIDNKDNEKAYEIIENNIEKLHNHPLYILEALINLNREKIIKLFVVFFIISLLCLYNNIPIYSTENPEPVFDERWNLPVVCFRDNVLEYFKELNQRFINDKTLRKTIQISASFALDSIFIVSFYLWVLYSVDWSLCFSFVFFYGIRSLLQYLLRQGLIENMYSPDPGFPSLLVGYHLSSDFFYSGHCGMPMILASEFYKQNRHILTVICSIITLLEVILMLSCREHYSIDIITGIFFGVYSHMIANYWTEILYEKNKKLSEIRMENSAELLRIGVSWEHC